LLSDFHTLAANKLHAAHNVLLHLHKLGELLCKIWAELTGRLAAEDELYLLQTRVLQWSANRI